MLSIYSYFKNEAQYLLKVVPSWINFADELVLIDTGSTDGSLELVQAMAKTKPGLKVVSEVIPWRPLDFCSFANAGMERCTEPWAIKLDADEELLGDPERFRQFLSVLDTYPLELARGIWFAFIEKNRAGDPELVCWKRKGLYLPDGWSWRFIIDEAPFSQAPELCRIMIDMNIAAILHHRESWRASSLERSVDDLLLIAEQRKGAPLTDEERAHYQNAIDRKKQFSTKG